MTAAEYCLTLVREAVAAAHRAQAEMVGSVRHDFDRMAINDALAHLERALAELSCFEEAGRAGGRRGPQAGKVLGRNVGGASASTSNNSVPPQ
jgi:hypothetical protein